MLINVEPLPCRWQRLMVQTDANIINKSLLFQTRRYDKLAGYAGLLVLWVPHWNPLGLPVWSKLEKWMIPCLSQLCVRKFAGLEPWNWWQISDTHLSQRTQLISFLILISFPVLFSALQTQKAPTLTIFIFLHPEYIFLFFISSVVGFIKCFSTFDPVFCCCLF